jgi:hypothetical protein
MDPVPENMKQLLPFYAAGTLDDAESKAVEAALQSQPELESDLAFWRRAASALGRSHDALAAGHPTAEHLVDYADGRLTQEPKVQSMIEAHLKGCIDCRSHMELAKQTAAESSSDPANRFGLWPRLAVAALLLVVATVFFMQRGEDEPQWASVTLEYDAAVRSGGQAMPNVLRLGPTSDSIELRLIIPPAGVPDMQYSVSVRMRRALSSRPSVELTQRIRFDVEGVLVVRAARGTAFPELGLYEIMVTEHPPDSVALLAETYAFVLEVLEAD